MNDEFNYTPSELKELFTSVGWAQNLTESKLYNAISNSSHLAVKIKDNKLVGIARSMDDGIYSANIDIVVVHKEYQGQGIGKELVKELLGQLSDIQYISVSPNEKKEIGLYLKCGFKLIVDGSLLQIENIG